MADTMKRYQEGASEAAAELVASLSSQVFAYFASQVRERSRAEDLLQDFWLRVHKARHSYRPGEPVLPWIYAIARRVRIDDYRRKSRIYRHEMQAEPLPEPPPASPAANGSSFSIDELLRDLPPSQRETVLLLKVAGLTLEEAARAMNTSVGAVKQKAHRAFEKLRRNFGTKSGIEHSQGQKS